MISIRKYTSTKTSVCLFLPPLMKDIGVSEISGLKTFLSVILFCHMVNNLYLLNVFRTDYISTLSPLVPNPKIRLIIMRKLFLCFCCFFILLFLYTNKILLFGNVVNIKIVQIMVNSKRLWLIY